MKNYCDMKMVPLAVEEVALVTGGDCECFCSSATSWFEPDSMGLVSNEKMCEAKCAASPRKLVMFDCILKSYNPIVNFLASSSFSAKLRQQMITGKNQ